MKALVLALLFLSSATHAASVGDYPTMDYDLDPTGGARVHSPAFKGNKLTIVPKSKPVSIEDSYVYNIIILGMSVVGRVRTLEHCTSYIASANMAMQGVAIFVCVPTMKGK